jgi:hypothetical protein
MVTELTAAAFTAQTFRLDEEGAPTECRPYIIKDANRYVCVWSRGARHSASMWQAG